MPRVIGSLGKASTLARRVVEKALKGSIPERLVTLCKENPQREIDILIALMPYCYPKLAQMEVKSEQTLLASEEVKQLANWLTSLNGPIEISPRGPGRGPEGGDCIEVQGVALPNLQGSTGLQGSQSKDSRGDDLHSRVSLKAQIDRDASGDVQELNRSRGLLNPLHGQEP